MDTGALLALLNKADPWHCACVAAYRSLQLPFLTSEAVLAELFHLLDREQKTLDAGWAMLDCGVVSLATIEHKELPAMRELMMKYRDRPMDFADATLVYLARRESISTIFTVDHNDFETYRIEGKRRFRIVPSRRS